MRFSPDRDDNYQTYIAVPVATSAEIFGLLTLNALNAGELLPQHEKEMLLLAQLLAIALAGGSKGGSSTKSAPEAEKSRPAGPAGSVARGDTSANA